MDVNKKLQDEIVITTYCGPQPPCNVDGVDYPDRVILEQYKLLNPKDIRNDKSPGKSKGLSCRTPPQSFSFASIYRPLVEYIQATSPRK